MKQLLTKKRNKKGFTLIEMIIVIVIIAILAAIAVPSMLGYVNKANEATATANCRAVVSAAQSAASLGATSSDIQSKTGDMLGTGGSTTYGDGTFTITMTTDSAITKVVWSSNKTGGKTATYDTTVSNGAIKVK